MTRTGDIEMVPTTPGAELASPTGIIRGPDGRIWFTSLGNDRIGRIDPRADDPAQTLETFAAPGLSKPVAIKTAADGRVWFSLRGADALGYVDPLAHDPIATLELVRGEAVAAPAAIFPAADGRRLAGERRPVAAVRARHHERRPMRPLVEHVPARVSRGYQVERARSTRLVAVLR